MIEALTFVKGSVARKDLVPALSHFHIKDGRIQGFNGMLSLSSPIDLDIDICPKATPFIKAIATCKNAVALNMTPKGRLSVKSGSFRALVDCFEEADYPSMEPEGEPFDLDENFLDAIKLLVPFIGEDASRPWSLGILFRGGSAFATNNIIVIEHWLGYDFPVEVNVPIGAIKELLRVKMVPRQMSVSKNSVTFYFDENRWLKSQVCNLPWPDLAPVLEKECDPQPFPEGLFDGLESIADFTGEYDSVYFLPTGISTGLVEDDVAFYEVSGLPEEGRYQAAQLSLLNGVAESIDFSLYPKPALFKGAKVRGAIVGMTMNG